MYFYPEDVKELAAYLRGDSADTRLSPAEWADRLDRVADEASLRMGATATVSIDPSGARGYAVPMERS